MNLYLEAQEAVREVRSLEDFDAAELYLAKRELNVTQIDQNVAKVIDDYIVKVAINNLFKVEKKVVKKAEKKIVKPKTEE